MNATPLTAASFRAALERLRDHACEANDEGAYYAGGVDALLAILPGADPQPAMQLEGAASITATNGIDTVGTPAPRTTYALDPPVWLRAGGAPPNDLSIEAQHGYGGHAPSLAEEEAQPAPTEPPPPQAPARSLTANPGRAGGVWTPERDAALRAAWVEGIAVAELLPRLNAMPGALPIASRQAVYNRATALKLTRPPEVHAMMIRRSGRVGAERAAELAAAGQASLGAKPIVWTPDREAMGRRLWEEGVHAAEIMARLNALPAAAQIASVHGIQTQASKRKWVRPEAFLEARRQQYRELMQERNRETSAPNPPAAETPPADHLPDATKMVPAPPPPAPAPEERTPAEEAAIADAAVAAKHDRLRESLRALVREKRDGNFQAIAGAAAGCKVPLNVATRLLGEVRREGKA